MENVNKKVKHDTEKNQFSDLSDDLQVTVNAFTGKSNILNRYMRSEFTCKPTSTKYRSLQTPGEECPPWSPNKEQKTRCCSSSLEDDDEDAAVEKINNGYIMNIRNILNGTLVRTSSPLSLKRIVAWINNVLRIPDSQTPTSFTDNIELEEDDKYIYDMVKLVLMTRSTTSVSMISTPTNYKIVSKGLHGDPNGIMSLVLNPKYKIYDGLVEVLNNVGVDHLTISLKSVEESKIVSFKPFKATSVQVVNGTEDIPFDIYDILDHFNKGNEMGWNQRTFYLRNKLKSAMKSGASFVEFIDRLVDVFEEGIKKDSSADYRSVTFSIDKFFDLPEGYENPSLPSLFEYVQHLVKLKQGGIPGSFRTIPGIPGTYSNSDDKYYMTYKYIDFENKEKTMEVTIMDSFGTFSIMMKKFR